MIAVFLRVQGYPEYHIGEIKEDGGRVVLKLAELLREVAEEMETRRGEEDKHASA